MSVKEKIKGVIESHNLMHLATLDSSGMPCLRGVDYAMADRENLLYFITGKDSRKVEQIRGNNNIIRDIWSWQIV